MDDLPRVSRGWTSLLQNANNEAGHFRWSLMALFLPTLWGVGAWGVGRLVANLTETKIADPEPEGRFRGSGDP